MEANRVAGNSRANTPQAGHRVAPQAPPNVISIPIAVVPSVATEARAEYWTRFLDARQFLRMELRLATPEWARMILETCNSRNRKLSTAWRKIFASIQRGAWEVVEPIIFDSKGNLADGQHRLMAIAESNEAVPLLVLYGVRPESFAVLDTGKKRNASDVLGIEGHESTKILAGAIAWQWRYESGQFSRRSGDTLPNDLIMALIADCPNMVPSVSWALSHYTRLVPPSLMAFIHYTLSSLDPEQAESFFSRVVDGIEVPKDSHESLLRKRLEGKVGMRSHMDQVEICALFFKTWVRIRKGDRVASTLRWSETEAFPAL